MKKVLAWAVALALVLSSFTMAFAGEGAKTSKDFKDASQINYVEAVDVMVATGIINGFPDGTFGPQKTVQRDQMAKMIACIMNGGEDVGDQYKSACPFADSKSSWAAGYIAYCASEHIIDGRSADVFDPTATVTGTEVAKMALTSLGYDSKIQGYTGETWAVNVLKDAKKNNLFEGLDSSFVPGDPCDRESAAQILFNMLKANEVDYPMNMSVSTGDTSVTVSGDAVPVDDPNSDVYGDYFQLYEDVFGGKLALNEGADAADDFGRPAHNWTYPDEDTLVGEYPDDADYEFTVKDATSMAKAIESYDKDLAKKITKNSVKINGQNAETIALGDKVELFVKDKKYDAVVTQYKPYKITKVETKKISKEDAEKGVTAYITFDALSPAGDGAASYYKDTEIKGYDAATYEKDAIVAVAAGEKNAILDSYIPEELVNGKVTKIKGTTYTIDGATYDPSGVFKTYPATTDNKLVVKGEYTVYDYNGYMFASVEKAVPAPEEFYGVVIATKAAKQAAGPGADDWSDAGQDAEKAMVKVFTPKEETLTLAVADACTTKPAKEDIGKLIKYQLNEDGDVSAVEYAKTAPAMGPQPEGTATEPTGLEPVKDGDVLYGKQLTEEVVAFALIPAATSEEKDAWKAYDLEDLKAAEGVWVKAYFDETAGISAMLVGSLEDKAVTKEEMAIVTDVQLIHLEDGDAYEITVLGEDKPFTTKSFKATEDPFATAVAAFNNDKVELAMFSFNKDGLVDSVRGANCKGVASASEKVDDSIDAVFFGDGTQAIPAGFHKVLSKSGTSLNVGEPGYINNQACTGATVYAVSVDKANYKLNFEESDLDSIQIGEEGDFALLMKLDASSSTWDTVFYITADDLEWWLD